MFCCHSIKICGIDDSFAEMKSGAIETKQKKPEKKFGPQRRKQQNSANKSYICFSYNIFMNFSSHFLVFRSSCFQV